LRLLTGDPVIADGLLVSIEGTQFFRLRYHVQCDSEWRCRRAEFDLLDGNRAKLLLTKEARGDWLKDDEPIRGSAECTDIDISGTPFTNTLPIRRLKLRPGQRAQIAALYI
jgi:hypothetical protein